jgi:hypothetical protein
VSALPDVRRDNGAKALEALDAIDRVDNPEDADRLLRLITAYQAAVKLARIGREHEQRWASVQLRAQRKMGELLGPAEHGGNRRSDSSVTETLENDEKQARKQARKLAAVPEGTFYAYLSTAEEPTRAGLLREAAKQAPPDPDKREPEYTHCPTCGHRVRADKPLRPRGEGK